MRMPGQHGLTTGPGPRGRSPGTGASPNDMPSSEARCRLRTAVNPSELFDSNQPVLQAPGPTTRTCRQQGARRRRTSPGSGSGGFGSCPNRFPVRRRQRSSIRCATRDEEFPARAETGRPPQRPRDGVRHRPRTGTHSDLTFSSRSDNYRAQCSSGAARHLLGQYDRPPTTSTLFTAVNKPYPRPVS